MDFSEDELKQIFKIFKDESDEHLNNINKCLLELEKRPDDAAIIAELFREAHSIKGSARMLGVVSIQNLAHKMEDLLGLAKDKTIIVSPEIIDILCRGVDAIVRIMNILKYNNLDYIDEQSDLLAHNIEALKTSLLSPEKKNTEQTETIKTSNINIPTTNLPFSENKSELNIILHYLEHIDNKFQQENSINEILSTIYNYLNQIENNEKREILELSAENLKYIKENKIIPQIEVKQAIGHALKTVLNNNADEDYSLIIQRQKILKQMLELSKENERISNLPDTKTTHLTENINKRKTKNENPATNYETGAFKTLRVDTQKLDKLENQVEELIVLKIKNKEHLRNIDNVLNEISEIQKRLNKLFNIYKYTEKKNQASTTVLSDNMARFYNLQSNIDKINEKTYNLFQKMDKLQKNFLNDDTRLNFLTDEIESMVKSIRVLPLATIFHMFPRMVRDIARTQNKQVDMIISGSETSADKTIIEELKAPLIHIIRNSVDHGIELPEERISSGKNPSGKILLNSYCSDSAITIEVIDDGKGISLEKIKEKVLEKKLLSVEELNQLTDSQIMNLLFWPGFTTGNSVTEISGRGVGLDVVHTKIAELDGKVSVSSQEGRGFKITIKIPITLATLKALLVKVNSQIFAISSSFVKTVTILSNDEIVSKEGKPHILYNGRTVRLVKLGELLNISTENKSYNKYNVVIIQIEDSILAIEVDEFLRTEEILQKKLQPPLTKVKNISGVSSLSTGEACLILNLNDIIKSALSFKELQRNSTILSLPEINKTSHSILIIDDSFTTLTLEKNILKSAGYKVIQATNGVDGYRKLLQEKIDMVITDIEMPEMDGHELIKKIRLKDSNIPIIVISSRNSQEEKNLCFQVGANAFLSKSDFSDKKLLNIIKSNLK